MRWMLFLPAIFFFAVSILSVTSTRCKAAALQREQQETAARAAEERRIAAAQKKAAAADRAADRERKAQQRKAAAAEREAEKQRKAQERLKIALEAAELERTALELRRERMSLDHDATKTVSGDAAKILPDAPRKAQPVTAESRLAQLGIHGNNAFLGQVVAFTGTIPRMTRREAIDAVQANGGKAFEDISQHTTLLVVGQRAGSRKSEIAADRGIRCVSAMQFRAMVQQPLTLTPEELIDLMRRIDAA